jgi:hypothetical protein
MMILNSRQIESNISWLLANSSPPVKYLTHRYLLSAEPGSRGMRDLWLDVERSESVTEIFSKQEGDGSWCCGGSWTVRPSYIPKQGYSPCTPKYATTIWVLSILGDMGFDRRDERVRRACEYTFSFQRANGFFSDTRANERSKSAMKVRNPRNEPCRFAIYVMALAKVGLSRDPRLRKSYELLLRWQRDDGGWVSERHKDGTAAPYVIWTRSCPWSTYHAAAALYHSGHSRHAKPLGRALEFLVWHLSTKDEREVCRPFYHGHTTIRELLWLSETGIGLSAKPVGALLDWLMAMYLPEEAHFSYRGKPVSRYSVREDGATSTVMKYRSFHLIEDDWLTYYMTRIAANMIRRRNRGSRHSAGR